MRRFKLTKYVDAEQMFQSNAEKVIGKIVNLTHGNDGYLVDDPENGMSWIPKSVFEKHAIPAHTHSEILNMVASELQSYREELKEFVKHCGLQNGERNYWYRAIRRVLLMESDIQKMLKCLRK